MRWRRKSTRCLSTAVAVLGAGLLVAPALVGAQAGNPPAVRSVELTGTVDPANERWLSEAMDDAEEAGAPLVILRLDTPGGLDTAMRSMVKRIIAAPMPVVVYVSPDGARAASAGLFLTQAADVAAMAPQTNIGSASPVQIGPGDDDEVLGRKIRNDATAYVRALAEGHGRDGDLAARMVEDAVNVTAPEAERAGLIDIVAPSEEALLAQLDGFRAEGPKQQTLNTAGVGIERIDTPFVHEVRQLLVNPTVASLLLLAGLAGIAIEVFTPGGIAPGVLGAVALVLGLYGTAQLPVTAAGVLLLALAVGLIGAETQVPSVGVLGGAGIAALVAGLLLLYDTDSEAFRVSAPAAVAAGVLLGGFVLFAASKALAVRHGPAQGGVEQLVGQKGVVRAQLDPVGQVFVSGALWRARAAESQANKLAPGAHVKVEAVDGHTLTVRPHPPTSERDPQ